DLSKGGIDELLELTQALKSDPSVYYDKLKGKSLGLIFQKPSNRTRASFEVGMYQLGGHTLYLGPDDIKLGTRESAKDIAQTLSRYLDIIVARTFLHKEVTDLAENATIPVINGLSDLLHPCQALADMFTIKEKFGQFEGLNMAYIGDGNNVLHSLLYAASKTVMNIKIATPKGYEPDKVILSQASDIAKETGSSIEIFYDKKSAARGADILYTDVWISMGQEADKQKRLRDFEGFQLDEELLSMAKSECVVMHCMPAHRGEEITGDVLDGPHSIVFDQAENRLHMQKAILLTLLNC
ncbi:MAG: ornithine carbamoyltransferase, partial [Candidatus Omnitrophota bacterium]